ncbi:hypothetical protein [Oceanibium sediminis]|uniref:hypothetical protein n=1 Tax=Oceanibium sediminis TaxID=2026339 RepID=UPI00130097EF|nr:hypothetical protein [Oceanibium sediminis]
MMSRCIRMLAAALAVSAWAGAATGADDRFKIHVQMHFAQGWSTSLMAPARELGVTEFRDGVYWNKIESTRGSYDFASVAAYFLAAARNGMKPLPVFATPNPVYDDSNTPYTDEGRQAYARFVGKTLEAYPDLITRFELGNEFNAPNFLKGPFEDDPAGYFAKLAAEVKAEVERVAPEVEMICTGAHSVALGYFRKLFEAGALEHCDAISLHPYRDFPEFVDRELTRLRELMREFGGEVPIYVTEFGKWFDDPAEAPDYLAKMAALLGASDVKAAWWYAYREQEWYPNMGLVRMDGSEMPAAATYRFLAKQLLPLGRPVRLSDDPIDQVYGFGTDGRAIIAWGGSGPVEVSGEDLRYFDTSGREIDPVTELSDAPFVVMGRDLSLEVKRPRMAFDSLYQFDAGPWSYHVQKGDGDFLGMDYVDTNWTSYIGNRFLFPVQVRVDTIIGAAFGGVPHWTTERFTAPADGVYDISAEWSNAKDDREGARIRLRLNGAVVASGVVGKASWEMPPLTLDMKAGDTLDFGVGPNADNVYQVLDRRITILGPPPT